MMDTTEKNKAAGEGEGVEKILLYKRVDVIMVAPQEKTAPTPQDKYYLVLIIFFVFGLGGMVPSYFFLTAHDFWMYKFRDTSLETYDLRKKTFLQKNFMTAGSMVNMIPAVLTAIFATILAHKINIRTRFLSTLGGLVATFFLFIIFVVVDTDDWQVGFFVLTMMIFCLITVAGTLFMMSCLTLLAKFPPLYIKVYMYGSSLSGVFSAAVQVACLALAGNSQQVGLAYFLIGTLLLSATFACAYIVWTMPFYNHFMGNIEEDTKRPRPTFADMKDMSRKIWVFLFLLVVGLPTMQMGYPNITSIVVSEDYGHGHAWNDKYFVPVISFLVCDIAALLGKLFATGYVTPKNQVVYIILALIKVYGMMPLFLFCNALPRKNLPVLFPHDWQYIVILCVNMFVDSYFTLVTLLSMKNFAGDKTELAFMVLQALGRTLMGITSPLGSLWVNIL